MRILGVIPARLASTRLPRKVLREIAGEPMLAWVYRAARAGTAGVPQLFECRVEWPWIRHLLEHCAVHAGDRGQTPHPDINANP